MPKQRNCKALKAIAPFFLSLPLLFPLNAIASESKATVQSFKDAYASYQQALEEGDRKAELESAKLANEIGQQLFVDNLENRINLRLNYIAALKENRQYESAYKNMSGLIEELEDGDQLTDIIHFQLLAEQISIGDRYYYSAPTSVQIRQGNLGRKLTSTAESLLEDPANDKAAIYYTLAPALTKKGVFAKNKKRAVHYYETAIETLSVTHGESDVKTIELLLGLGKVHEALKNQEEAAQTYERIISITDSVTEKDHPYELASHARLVGLYEGLGDSEKATEHCIAIGSMQPWTEDLEQTPLYRVNPKYPSAAARTGQNGWVKIKFTVDEQGFVKEPEVIDSKGHSGFKRESIDALKQWRYAPKFEGGSPISAESYVQIDFKIAD